ncbi:MAG TPA: ECF-type sigma factor [Pirellulales bacterium]|nr:ECF-type sigma factor [Pirellulales bacterium]
MSTSSVSQWIASLRDGNFEIVGRIWERYCNDLVAAAKGYLARFPNRTDDEHDIAQNVIMSIYRGAMAGRLNAIKNRDELWWLLLRLTNHKCLDMVRREMAQKRGGGRVRTESALPSVDDTSPRAILDQLISDAPSPEFLAMMQEQSRRLMDSLRNDQLRSVAVARIEGYTIGEIAAKHSLTERTIERKLQLIRNAWTKELSRARRESDNI